MIYGLHWEGDADEDGRQLIKPSESLEGWCLTRGELETNDSKTDNIDFIGTSSKGSRGPHQSLPGGSGGGLDGGIRELGNLGDGGEEP